MPTYHDVLPRCSNPLSGARIQHTACLSRREAVLNHLTGPSPPLRASTNHQIANRPWLLTSDCASFPSIIDVSEFRMFQVGTANPIVTLDHFGARVRPPSGSHFESRSVRPFDLSRNRPRTSPYILPPFVSTAPFEGDSGVYG